MAPGGPAAVGGTFETDQSIDLDGGMPTDVRYKLFLSPIILLKVVL